MSTLVNNLWFLLGGFILAIYYAVFGQLCAIIIVGIPFAKAHWRLLKLSFLPFGSSR